MTAYVGASPLTISNVTYRGIDFSHVVMNGNWTGSNITFIDCNLGPWAGFLLDHDIFISHSKASGIQFDGTTRATVEFTDFSGFQDDPMQVFSSHAMNYDINIRHNWVHNGGVYTNHIDGVQVRGGVRVSITENFFNIPYVSTSSTGYVNSCVLIDAPGTTGGNQNIIVSNNWLYGGGYTFRLGSPTPGNVILTNNVFVPGLWGAYINHTNGATQLQQAFGNVLASTGAAVPGIPIIP